MSHGVTSTGYFKGTTEGSAIQREDQALHKFYGLSVEELTWLKHKRFVVPKMEGLPTKRRSILDAFRTRTFRMAEDNR
jgi:hypothetical protein